MATATRRLASLVDRGLMAADWAAALAPVEADIAAMGDFLRAEVAAGRAASSRQRQGDGSGPLCREADPPSARH